MNKTLELLTGLFLAAYPVILCCAAAAIVVLCLLDMAGDLPYDLPPANNR